MKKKQWKGIVTLCSLILISSPFMSQAADSDSSDDSTTTTDAYVGGGTVDKSSDFILQAMINNVEPKFIQLEYTDESTGLTIPYNLYIPDHYDPHKSYPLITFIADSSVVGEDTTAPLEQGWGGLIWATDTEQQKHPSFVLVPEYPETTVGDSYVTTDYVDLTPRMIQSIVDTYSIDTDRLYVTGQSMGCMMFLDLTAEYPDMFAAEMFVSGQWDIDILQPLETQKFFYIVSAGDDKASTGQAEVIDMFTDDGVPFSEGTWSAQLGMEDATAQVNELLSEGLPNNFVIFEKGTTLPDGTDEDTSEHMYSFDYAYKLERVRDWLFAQRKTPTVSE